MAITKIVSGGQTGVDQGALDAALDLGMLCGGWCPEGRQCEDGVIPERYPVEMLAGASYTKRTLQNVLDSDGTLIFHYHQPTGGTERTHQFCIEHHRPHLLIDAAATSPERAAEKIRAFVEESRVGILNVAGPRASKEPHARKYAEKALRLFLEQEKVA